MSKALIIVSESGIQPYWRIIGLYDLPYDYFNYYDRMGIVALAGIVVRNGNTAR